MSATAQQDDVVLRAMKDELARSMKQLQLENLEKPYFIAYRVQDRSQTNVAASFGALVSSNSIHVRFLTVEIRVGSPTLDNTNFLSMSSMMGGGLARGVAGAVEVPLDDNYTELRRQIWLATDGAYKKVLDDLARKRAALENKTSTEDLPDFSLEPPGTYNETPGAVQVDVAQLETMARRLSGIFKDSAFVYRDSANFDLTHSYTRYVNSEGTTFTRNTDFAAALVLAETQAADGMSQTDTVAAYGHTLKDLPAEQDLETKVRAMGERLQKMCTASLVDRYNGPVLFEGEAAGELFSRVIAPNLLASRRPVSDNPQFGFFAQRLENPFQDKLGGRVLPDFMSAVDDPTLSEYQGKPLLGADPVDDDGLATRRTDLVDHGLLKTLLATRTPIQGVLRSTGSRHGVAAAPSNLILSVENGVSEQALREKLLSIVKQRGKPYGIIVERLANPLQGEQRDVMQSMMSTVMPGQGSDSAGVRALVAYEVFPDGHQELVRNVSVDGVNATSFKDMVAASSEMTVYSIPFMSLGPNLFAMFSSGGAPADSSPALVSFVVPAMLFDDVTLKRPVGQIPKPPLSSRPVSGN